MLPASNAGATLNSYPSEDPVVESLPMDDASTQKRRSTRIVQAVPITVSGVDALGQPFKERTTTVMVNVHGCKYQSKHYVPKNSTIKLEIPHPDPSLPARSTVGRVVWVQRPRAVRELFQIGLEFEVAGNIWGIAFPPEDWFAYPGDESPAAAPAEFAIAPETKSSAAPAPKAPETVTAPPAQVPSPAAPIATPPAESKVHVMPGPAPSPAPPPASSPAATPQDALATARQMAKMVEDAKDTLDKTLKKGALSAINDEMTIVRQQLDVQLHEAVERAIKVSMDRVSESAVKKVVQQAADRTNAIVEEARKASDTNAENLDAKVRQAVEQAVSQAANQAAQQAAEQAAAHNLKNAVEEAVERVISQREASTPSLGILSSPEAAQQHLDQWKKDLEDTAQSVRARTIDETQSDAASAKQRWNDEFEAAVNGASQNLGQKIGEASQAALAQAEREIAERQSGVRASFDEAVSSAQATIQSLGSGLEQERARAEIAKTRLEEAARSTIDETRRNLEDIAAVQHQEAVRRADQAIAERTQQIEPVLRNSAQQVLDRLSTELDEKLASKD